VFVDVEGTVLKLVVIKAAAKQSVKAETEVIVFLIV
jgi:hypothetical protein